MLTLRACLAGAAVLVGAAVGCRRAGAPVARPSRGGWRRRDRSRRRSRAGDPRVAGALRGLPSAAGSVPESEDAGAGGTHAASKDGVVPLPLAPAFWRKLLKGGDALPEGGLA